MSDKGHGRDITLDEMLALRASTEKISTFLATELQDRLDTLRPLTAPRRFLADHVKSPGSEEGKDADANFTALQEGYREIAGEPLRLPGRLLSPLESIPLKVEAHAWEYTHTVESAGESVSITVRSPVSWVILHSASLNLSQVRQMIRGGGGRSDTELRQFAVHALLMRLVLQKSSGLQRLLEALRYKVEIVSAGELGPLPLVRLSAPVPSFRPADAMLLSATRMSGVAIFQELIDLDGALAAADPLREQIGRLAGRG